MIAGAEREAGPDAEAVNETLERVAAANVRLVDLLFSDITGGAKALTIPVELLADTMAHGYRFDGSALTGTRRIELDLFLVPDPTTLLISDGADPRGRRARICCSVRRRDGQPFDGDPRSVLERALADARAAGFEFRVGIEIEYYLVRGDWPNVVRTLDAAGYFDVGEETSSRVRDEVVSTLDALGISVGGAHHETGPGQEELDLLPADALRMADQLITVRQVVREVAQRHGLRATFMPKPFSDAPGSGMHIFQRLRRYPEGTDALVHGGDALAATAYHFIGGQLAHARAMCAVLCPTVNSYKRLNAGHRAPRHATWAHVSQSSLIRVPSWAPGEEAAIELRSPDATANPYLALAVTLACGMDGIRQGEEPPEPLEESLTAYDDEGMQRIGVPRLPTTLGEALSALTQDTVVQEALGDYVYDQLLSVKRDEWEEYRAQVGPWELRRYGDA
ncbi:MAG TPA: glutamine synthetase family protein [Thermomicrobiales bacterium]|mgnify:CR=1 FL=1